MKQWILCEKLLMFCIFSFVYSRCTLKSDQLQALNLIGLLTFSLFLKLTALFSCRVSGLPAFVGNQLFSLLCRFSIRDEFRSAWDSHLGALIDIVQLMPVDWNTPQPLSDSLLLKSWKSMDSGWNCDVLIMLGSFLVIRSMWAAGTSRLAVMTVLYFQAIFQLFLFCRHYTMTLPLDLHICI